MGRQADGETNRVQVDVVHLVASCCSHAVGPHRSPRAKQTYITKITKQLEKKQTGLTPRAGPLLLLRRAQRVRAGGRGGAPW